MEEWGDVPAKGNLLNENLGRGPLDAQHIRPHYCAVVERQNCALRSRRRAEQLLIVTKATLALCAAA